MRILANVLVPVLALASLLVGCSSIPRNTEPYSNSLVLNAEELAQLLDNPDLVILHVADEQTDYDEGHVPGARYLPVAAIAVNQGNVANMLPSVRELEETFRALGISNSSRVVLYGDRNGLSAARAFFALDATGHKSVSVLNGGLNAWRDAGGMIVTEPAPLPERGDFVPRLQTNRMIVASEIADRLPSLTLIDGRPDEEYTGTNPGRDIQRPGHIPGAVSLFWEEDLLPDGTLRPLAELRRRYAVLDAAPGDEVVTYCRTGMQASHAYLVAKLLGLDVALYDGSFLDWSNNTDFPVETGR